MKNRKWPAILLGLVITLGSIFFTAYLKQRRRDRNQNLIAEVIYKEKEVKWVKSSFYGLNFESPTIGLDPLTETSDFNFEGVKTGKANFLVTGDLFYSVLFMDLESDRYDLEKGMEGSLTNLIKELGGYGLNYKFKYGESWLPYALAEGEFMRNAEPIILKAFLSFNKTLNKGNKLRILVVLGSKTDQNQKLLDRSITSVDLVSLKKEKNPLKLIAENGGQKFRNYDPNDTIETPRTPDQEEALKRIRELRERMEGKQEKKEFQVPYKYRE